jgi:hypothetical protein
VILAVSLFDVLDRSSSPKHFQGFRRSVPISKAFVRRSLYAASFQKLRELLSKWVVQCRNIWKCSKIICGELESSLTSFSFPLKLPNFDPARLR